VKLRPSIADIAVLVVVLVALFLPPRALTAGTVGKFDADGRQVTRIRLAPAGGGQTPAAQDVVTSRRHGLPVAYSGGRGRLSN